MILPLPAPMAEYVKSIFLPTFRVFEWEKSQLTLWFDRHALSVKIADELPVDTTYDLIHIPKDLSYDYRRVRLSTSHVRPYGWMLLTMPLTSNIWWKIEQYLSNWTCVFTIPPFELDHQTAILLRKPGQWTGVTEERMI